MTQWRANDDAKGSIVTSNNGVTMAPTAGGGGAVFDLNAPISLEGATLTVVINASSEYKASGSNIQPFAQLKDGMWPGKYCWFANASITAGVDQELTCLLDTTADDLNSTTAGAQIGIMANGSAVTGTVLIKSAKITYPAPTFAITNFESDTVGAAVYGVVGNETAPATATVVTIASVTGLPANGTSTKVAKVASSENYNTIPKFLVTLPQGKTLANYKVKVDAYFPKTTAGYTGDDNYYKDFLLLAGTTITGTATTASTFYLSKVGTVYNDVDVWKNFTLTVDATKGALLTGTIEIGLGINRPISTGSTDAYYLDNIILEEIQP